MDSKWTQGKPVTFEELKPITQSPDDVSLWGAGWVGTHGRVRVS